MNVTFLWTDISHSQWNFESSPELYFKSGRNYFLIDKYFDTKLVKNYTYYSHDAMFTEEMAVLILEFCECDVCPSNVRPRYIHNCHIHSFLIWILIIFIEYKGKMKV